MHEKEANIEKLKSHEVANKFTIMELQAKKEKLRELFIEKGGKDFDDYFQTLS